MKKKMYLFGYLGLLVGAVSLQSCNGGPIDPYCGGSGADVDTTMVYDSTIINNGGGIDSTGGNPNDSTGWNPGDTTYCPGCDSTTWSPDSTGFGG
jgi:hypothetical protein